MNEPSLRMVVDFTSDEFTPFNDVFKQFNEEEKEHIHVLLVRYRKLLKNPKLKDGLPTLDRIEAKALYWILSELRNLEYDEE